MSAIELLLVAATGVFIAILAFGFWHDQLSMVNADNQVNSVLNLATRSLQKLQCDAPGTSYSLRNIEDAAGQEAQAEAHHQWRFLREGARGLRLILRTSRNDLLHAMERRHAVVGGNQAVLSVRPPPPVSTSRARFVRLNQEPHCY